MADIVASEKTEIGEIKISNEVVSIIACNVTAEVKGVSSMSGGIAGNISQVFGVKNLAKGVKVEINGNNVELDLNIIVEYGSRIPEVAWKIQEKVKEAIESMTGLTVNEINIHVQGISFDKETKDQGEENDIKESEGNN